MSVDALQLSAQQLAAAFGSTAQQIRLHRAPLVQADSTLAGPFDGMAKALEDLEQALGKIAWAAPAPTP